MLLIKTDWDKLKRRSSSRLGLPSEWEEEYRVLEELFKGTELEQYVAFVLLEKYQLPERWVIYLYCPGGEDKVPPSLRAAASRVCKVSSSVLATAIYHALRVVEDQPLPPHISAAFFAALVRLEPE